MTEATDRREVNRLTYADVLEVELAARRIVERDATGNADDLLTVALARTGTFRVTRHDLRAGEIHDLTARCGRILAAARGDRWTPVSMNNGPVGTWGA